MNGIGLWITQDERKQNRDDVAVQSVLTALNTTKLYLARRERGEPIDYEAERELVKLWTSAAVHIRKTDSELAKRLQTKADYWTNPKNWSENEIINNGIQIDRITIECGLLLSAI